MTSSRSESTAGKSESMIIFTAPLIKCNGYLDAPGPPAACQCLSLINRLVLTVLCNFLGSFKDFVNFDIMP
jgi:hypothetical protein